MGMPRLTYLGVEPPFARLVFAARGSIPLCADAPVSDAGVISGDSARSALYEELSILTYAGQGETRTYFTPQDIEPRYIGYLGRGKCLRP
uniref:Uncharacterized protein n=1 Tax=Candidatus Kentrum sp. TC TaxID=2126339 RepID=A0A450YIR1_9GAMM|nr:MAG: hypothetical protein BECKTC1821E_GA0114239_101137 [Candidatus Kentron sp. TC]VFK59278.1 MAG: hypothetical protein BECKTC1821F_GA0114240_103115 [Candidatus Kentron sp. TC]